MLNPYARRGYSRHRKHHHYRMITIGAALAVLIGIGALAAALALTNLRLPYPIPDVRKFAFIVLLGLLGIGSVAYWGIMSVVVWRWSKARERRGRTSADALQTAQVMPDQAPKRIPSTIARQGKHIPAVTLSSAEFEQEVAWVFGTLFKLQAEVVGRANDGGIDVKLYDSGGTLVGIIQAKRYDEKKTLNPSFLRELDSCKRRMGVAHAYLVTTARFSADLRRQAEEMHIDLVDGSTFEEWRQQAYARAKRK